MATRDAVRPPAQWSTRIETSAPTGSVKWNDGDRAVGLAQEGVAHRAEKGCYAGRTTMSLLLELDWP